MMKIKKYVDNRYDGNCYLIINDKEAIIIDPTIEKEKLKLEKSIKIVAVFITHAHFDHIIALDSYIEDEIKIYLHPYAYHKLNSSLKNLSCLCHEKVAISVPEQMIIKTIDEGHYLIANLDCQIIHTSGHSNCSQCILIDRSLFTGDTLFKNDVGRTDLPTGSSKNLQESLKKIVTLPYDYTIYPGHGEMTTLIEEKNTNPYLKGERDV